MIDNGKKLSRLIIKIRQQQDFIDKNKRGNHMYSAALNLYGVHPAMTVALAESHLEFLAYHREQPFKD